MECYLLADAIGQFENIYNSNQERGAELQYVDFDQCKESVLDIENRKDLSQAKKAAVDGFVKNDATDASAAEKIDAVEKEGLSRIENGLKNYNTNELMQGLCEVIASRSAKLHKDDLDPQNIERALSPESISRVRTHFGKKLETALKDITKDEFMNIMRSEDIGGKMAEKVQVNLNKNGKEAPVKNNNEKTVKDPVRTGPQ